jgi:hypothetical protein
MCARSKVAQYAEHSSAAQHGAARTIRQRRSGTGGFFAICMGTSAKKISEIPKSTETLDECSLEVLGK